MASTVLGTSMTFPSAQLAVSSSPFSQMMMGTVLSTMARGPCFSSPDWMPSQCMYVSSLTL